MNKPNIPIGGYAFTGNPIFLTDRDGVLGQNQSGHFIVKIGGTQIYEGKCTAPVRINIADIVDSYTDRLPDIPKNTNDDDNIHYLLNFTERNLVEGWVVNCEDDISDDVRCHVIPGGISRQNFRRLNELGTDIFEARFLNRRCNFFMTTRSAGFCLHIKETELYPLYFIIEDDSLAPNVRDMITGITFDCWTSDISAGVSFSNQAYYRRLLKSLTEAVKYPVRSLLRDVIRQKSVTDSNSEILSERLKYWIFPVNSSNPGTLKMQPIRNMKVLTR